MLARDQRGRPDNLKISSELLLKMVDYGVPATPMLRSLSFRALILAITLPISGYAQAQSGKFTQRTVIVNVRDMKGNFVSSLGLENFRARKTDVGISAVRSAERKRRVVIVLDASGSMARAPIPEVTRFTAGELVHSLPGEPEFALVVFARKVEGTVPFGHSRKEVLSAIDEATFVEHKGQTSLWDALSYAMDLLSPAQIGDVVVVASDGGDSTSNTSADKLKMTYISAGVRVFAFEPKVGITASSPSGPVQFQTEEQILGIDKLRDFATVTGGAAVAIEENNAPHLFTVTHMLEDQISKYYLLDLTVPESLKKATQLRLEVVNSLGKNRKDLKITYPQYLPIR